MNTLSFKQTNAYAMQYGILLGIWGFLALTFSILSYTNAWLGWISNIFMLGSPVVGCLMTLRFRREVSESPSSAFTLGRGFAFTFMLGIYACVWISLAVFVYFQWFDHGYVCSLYEQMFSTGDFRTQMARSGVNESQIQDYLDAMRSLTPGSYAATIIFLTLIANGPISLVIALIARRSERFAPRGGANA